MKVYVCGYKREDSEPQSEDERPRKLPPLTVGYAHEPAWRMAHREEADLHCSILNTSAVKVESHRCSFSVEKLAAGGFALTCEDHPVPTESV